VVGFLELAVMKDFTCESDFPGDFLIGALDFLDEIPAIRRQRHPSVQLSSTTDAQPRWEYLLSWFARCFHKRSLHDLCSC